MKLRRTLLPPPFTPTPVELERLWVQGDRGESVPDSRKGSRWNIQDLMAAVKDEPAFELPVKFIDISVHKFDADDLFEFAQHMKHCLEADLSYPIIMDHRGRIIDGRHRIVKALVEGRATILCKKIPYGVNPTYWE